MKIEELNRIAYLSYHRLNCQCTVDELYELIGLLTNWKNWYDKCQRVAPIRGDLNEE